MKLIGWWCLWCLCQTVLLEPVFEVLTLSRERCFSQNLWIAGTWHTHHTHTHTHIDFKCVNVHWHSVFPPVILFTFIGIKGSRYLSPSIERNRPALESTGSQTTATTWQLIVCGTEVCGTNSRRNKHPDTQTTDSALWIRNKARQWVFYKGIKI